MRRTSRIVILGASFGGLTAAQAAVNKDSCFMKTLFVLNDPPYGTERSYNGFRLAGSLAKRDGEDVRVFLIGDAAACAKRGQAVPNGYYNLERMMRVVTQQGGEVGVCGSCMDARGIADSELAEGTHRSTMDKLTDWTVWADRVVVF